jgi:hypothetical protein
MRARTHQSAASVGVSLVLRARYAPRRLKARTRALARCADYCLSYSAYAGASVGVRASKRNASPGGRTEPKARD